MNASASSSRPLGDATAILAEIVEEVTNKFQAGEAVDVEEYVRAHPELSEQLRQFLPALQVLADLGHSAASGAAVAMAPVETRSIELGELGDFRIVREVGRGGMGVVYEAMQISLGRRVALKILPFAAALDPKHLQRFKNEAQAAAHLQHTNIVAVHYVGCERGVHFYAMQYIEGQTLAALISDLHRLAGPEVPGDEFHAGPEPSLARELASGRWAWRRRSNGERMGSCGDVEATGPYHNRIPAHQPTPLAPHDVTPPVAAVSTERSTRSPGFFRTVAHLGVQAAEALEHAHQFGVIHRDIKPANLLVDAGGRLWITDFGLAYCQSQPGLTMTGDLVGTLRYMSPEQALAKRVTLDARTDVYSLGVTLYELLTLEPAYNGRNREEVLRQIAFEEPQPPKRLNKAVPAELETIVLKAMAKNPDERYSIAQELADDLRRFLEDEPIKARRPTLGQRATKWARRHKTAVRAAFSVLVLATMALTVSTVFIWHALERERQIAYFHRINLAEREWSANNLARVEELLDACPTDLRGWEWNYLRRLRRKSLPLVRQAGAVLSFALSPDGEQIASSSQGGIIKVWNAKTGRELRAICSHDKYVLSMALSPDGLWLASSSSEGIVKVWDAQTGREVHTLKGHQGDVGSVTFSPDGKRLASAGGIPEKLGEVKIWDVTTGQEERTLRGHTSCVYCVVFSPDGQRLATGAAKPDKTVKLWDAHTGREQLTLAGHQHDVWGVAFSPDGRLLASCGASSNMLGKGHVKVWNTRTGQEVLQLGQQPRGVLCLAFSSNGRRLATGSLDETVRIWDARSGQEALTLRGHLEAVRSVMFSPDGHRLLSCGLDGTVRAWDATPLGQKEEDEDCLTLRGHSDEVTSVAFDPKDANIVASASIDGTIKLWDTRTAKGLGNMRDPSGGVYSVAFSPDGRLLATAGQEKNIKIWDAGSATRINTLSGQGSGDRSVVFLPDGQQIASGGWEGIVRVWEVETGNNVHTIPAHDSTITSVACSPNGRLVASASFDGKVRFWDVPTGKEANGTQLQNNKEVQSVAFSGDGRRFASACQDRLVKVWDTATWKLLLALPDTTGVPRSVAVSPDGRRLAWGGTDSTVKVWEASSGEIQVLHGHTNWVHAVAFSPDGQQIASASADGTVRIWRAPAVTSGGTIGTP
jgi:WD40 repeat protein/serine/threonine protein kinase